MRGATGALLPIAAVTLSAALMASAAEAGPKDVINKQSQDSGSTQVTPDDGPPPLPPLAPPPLEAIPPINPNIAETGGNEADASLQNILGLDGQGNEGAPAAPVAPSVVVPLSPTAAEQKVKEAAVKAEKKGNSVVVEKPLIAAKSKKEEGWLDKAQGLWDEWTGDGKPKSGAIIAKPPITPAKNENAQLVTPDMLEEKLKTVSPSALDDEEEDIFAEDSARPSPPKTAAVPLTAEPPPVTTESPAALPDMPPLPETAAAPPVIPPAPSPSIPELPPEPVKIAPEPPPVPTLAAEEPKPTGALPDLPPLEIPAEMKPIKAPEPVVATPPTPPPAPPPMPESPPVIAVPEIPPVPQIPEEPVAKAAPVAIPLDPLPIPSSDPNLAPLALESPEKPVKPHAREFVANVPTPVFKPWDIPAPPREIAREITKDAFPELAQKLPEDLSAVNVKTPKSVHTGPAKPLKPQLQQPTKDILDALPSGMSSLPEEEPKPKRIKIERGGFDTSEVFPSEGYSDEGAVGITMQSKQAQPSTEQMLDQAYQALVYGQMESAIAVYKQVLQQDPDNRLAMFGLATAYQRNQQIPQARTAYKRLFAIYPNYPEALNNFIVLMSEEAPDEALLELEKLEKRNPTFSPITAQIGMIHFQMGNNERASQYLSRAVNISPENIVYRYNLAVVMDKMGQPDEAKKLYLQVIEASKTGASLPVSVADIQRRLTYLERK